VSQGQKVLIHKEFTGAIIRAQIFSDNYVNCSCSNYYTMYEAVKLAHLHLTIFAGLCCLHVLDLHSKLFVSFSVHYLLLSL